MSSLGNQWRVLRHYLSLTSWNAEMEKVVQKLKPATPEQWASFIKKLKSTLSTRLNQSQTTATQNIVKATAVEETQTDTKETVTEKADKEEKAVEGYSENSPMTFEGLMRGLKMKKDLHFGKISEPSWKDNKPMVTKTSIHSRTAYVISALLTAETDEALRRRADHFVDHLLQYPEARDYAIKEGAVRALLRVRHRLRAHTALAAEVRGIITEALALVGHAEWGGRGPRILSLDGGGVRGLAAVAVLRRLEAAAGRPVARLFDYIVGVSTGAIIAALVGPCGDIYRTTPHTYNAKKYLRSSLDGADRNELGSGGNLEMANEMYLTLSKKMFGNTSVIGGTSRLVWTHSYYDTAAWERLLQEYLGQTTLSQCNRIHAPKLALVSCAWHSGARLSPFLFRSYECGYRVRSNFPGDCRAKLWHAVRASAAAPTYFEDFRLNGVLHQDGGIMVNNPTGVGLHEARLVFGAEAMRRATVVSVGTGKRLPPAPAPPDPPASSWRDKFNKILDSATDTEGVHQVLQDLLPAGSYYRFNPPLLAPVAMDETCSQRLRALQQDAHDYCRRNHHKITQAAERLTQPRTLPQRVADWARTRAVIVGALDPR